MKIFIIIMIGLTAGSSCGLFVSWLGVAGYEWVTWRLSIQAAACAAVVGLVAGYYMLARVERE